ncbi:hypothetical protein GGR57DRAFT_325642 [Xylariaceae sp. FL1272]|nr:hypothetical protein GGR57DRAFT_325642 [Xylariaceae sp. FL1272]
MPVMKSLAPWPNPQDSIGRQMLSSKLKRRQVWWPRGPALEAFEQVIQPEIANLLKVVDLGHSDLFIRLYMIGRRPEDANPIVMLCCTNENARKEAEFTIRHSGLLTRHQGFGLGAAALPLEHPTPIRRLAGEHSLVDNTIIPIGSPNRDSEDVSDADLLGRILGLVIDPPSSVHRFTSDEILIHTSSPTPRIGRIMTASAAVNPSSSRTTTGGVIIETEQHFYQLTAGHIFEENIEPFDTKPIPTDFGALEELHFDGQSDESDEDSCTTGRGSATPEDEGSSSDSTTSGSVVTLSDRRVETTRAPGSRRPTKNSAERIGSEHNSHRSFQKSQYRKIIGCMPRNQRSDRSLLDYALVLVSKSAIEELGSKVNQITESFCVRNIAAIGPEECEIVMAMPSGVSKGVLLPGAIPYRCPGHTDFQHVYQVRIDCDLTQGDCGSPVVDRLTGDLYGHLVMGTDGGRVGYIISATSIFDDFKAKTGLSIVIATTTKSTFSLNTGSELNASARLTPHSNLKGSAVSTLPKVQSLSSSETRSQGSLLERSSAANSGSRRDVLKMDSHSPLGSTSPSIASGSDYHSGTSYSLGSSSSGTWGTSSSSAATTMSATASTDHAAFSHLGQHLPCELVAYNDTLAEQKSRDRKAQVLEDLEASQTALTAENQALSAKIQALQAEIEHWKSVAATLQPETEHWKPVAATLQPETEHWNSVVATLQSEIEHWKSVAATLQWSSGV